MPRQTLLLTSLGIIAIIGLIIAFLGWPRPALSPEDGPTASGDSTSGISQPTSEPLPTNPNRDLAPTGKTIPATAIPDAAAEWQFTAIVPTDWRVEAVPAIAAINFFDSAASGETTLEQSQIFMRTFTANDFLTLSTVEILAQRELTINSRPAVEYRITRESTAAPFPSQPNWRNEQHIVTDIRVSDDNPSVFYVIAKRPDLDDATYQQFLEDLAVIAPPVNVPDSAFTEPIAEFTERITKKPFGIFITPANSPIQPERFSGYHTAVDVEYEDTTTDVPIYAIADGTVARATTASGYGGVLVVEHQLAGETITVLYGHLEPTSLPAVGTTVTAGDELGRLGTGGTAATDGERKHLHFGIHRGATVDIRGYVTRQGDLDQWVDPLTLF